MDAGVPRSSRSDSSDSAGAPPHATLALLRHGQSEWNRDRRFAGWSDVALSDAGRAEAERAGQRLQRAGCTFDCCFTSTLQRAADTAGIVLRTMGLESLPVERSWRLNERHYGALQGLGLWPAVRRYGLLKVLRCRKFEGRPPQVDHSDPRFPGNDPRYASVPVDQLPHGESLADTQARLLPYWKQHIVPQLRSGRRVLVVSHNNTLRLLLELIARGQAWTGVPGADTRMQRASVPTGVPIVFSLDASLAIRDRCVLASDVPASGGHAAGIE